MPTANEKLVDQVMRQGNVLYVYDPVGKHSYAIAGNTAGIAGIGVASSSGVVYALKGDASGLAGRTHLIFYPGRSAMSGGAVASGTRTGAGTITTGGTADSTYWGPESIFAPLEVGKIDGISSGGIITGQITVGLDMASGTVLGKVTARIRNNPTAATADTTAWDTLLTLSGTISCSTAEAYNAYDIPHLQTSASCNAVPFGIAIGVQTAVAASAVIGRIMESSYIEFDVIPGT